MIRRKTSTAPNRAGETLPGEGPSAVDQRRQRKPGYVEADFHNGQIDFRMEEHHRRNSQNETCSIWTQDWHITQKEPGVTTYTLVTSQPRNGDRAITHADFMGKLAKKEELAGLLPTGKVVVTKRIGANQHPDLEMVHGRENLGQYAGRKAREMAPYAQAAWTTTGNAVASGRRALGAFAQAWREAGQENTTKPDDGPPKT